MAGTYLDVPGHRMAYDRDGSIGVHLDLAAGSVLSELTTAQMQSINDEDSDAFSVINGSNLNRALAVIFPELRDVVAYRIMGTRSTNDPVKELAYSTNTTNGIDGTWVTAVNPFTFHASFDKTQLRQYSTVSMAGVKAVRFRVSHVSTNLSVASLHLYGGPSTGAAPDRLRFYDPAAASEVGGAYFDWGDIARGSSVSRTFRIHNPSATLTANSVTVSMEALSDTAPANTGQHEFSVDGGLSWATTAALGNLAPGATSGVITLRRNTAASAALGLWWTRMVASASSWS